MQKSIIFQNQDNVLVGVLGLQNAFTEGFLNKGSLPIVAGKNYKLKAMLILENEPLSAVISNFEINGFENCENVNFSKAVIDDYENSFKINSTFSKQLFTKNLNTPTSTVFLNGTFKAVQNCFLIPKLEDVEMSATLTIKKGSYFMIEEIATTDDIL